MQTAVPQVLDLEGETAVTKKMYDLDNRHAFSIWLTGGGFKAGYCHGVTDEVGYRAVEDIVTVHDLHATLFQTLSLNHHRLTCPHDGRQASLSDAEVTGARIVPELLA